VWSRFIYQSTIGKYISKLRSEQNQSLLNMNTDFTFFTIFRFLSKYGMAFE
jgi:hypothetical protein